MTAHDLASALGAIRRGQHFWAYCPVHEADNRKHRPSLEISEGRTVPIVVKCWAGCSQSSILRQLQQLNLWRMPTTTPQQRRQYAREQAERKAAVRDLEDYLECLDRLKLKVQPWSKRWVILCQEQGDIRRKIIALGGSLATRPSRSFRDEKVVEGSRTMAARAG